VKQLGNRNLLRRQLKKAWRDTMACPYLDQAINSERALQVHLSARLMNAFEAEGLNRQLFIEPRVSAHGGEGWLHPDILVCNSREVIGIIELKYQPLRQPSWEKDFRSLESVGWSAGQIEVDNPRYKGPNRGERVFSIANNPLFVWAGVYSAPYRQIPQEEPPEQIASNLLVLHAATHADRAPDCFAGTRAL
jgi:hypothetical protein